MKKIIFSIVVVALFSCNTTDKKTSPEIYGKWNTHFKDGSEVLAVFRKDGTHDYFINGKLFSTGKFSVANNQLSEADPICHPDYYATYNILFPSDNELQLTVIQDTCKPRIHDLDGIKMKRAE